MHTPSATSLQVTGGERAAGSLSQAHAGLSDKCTACHVKPFEAVRDTACKACHTAVHDHADPFRLARARPDLSRWRRIELAFESGYAYAQVFAPAISDVICFEPMTAPADALRNTPTAVEPGESFSARFSISAISVR